MKAVGIILAGGSNEMRLGELTGNRAASALPVGSCYRIIDFPLSNMTSSGISKVAVITQYNSRSLHDHLISSKWWDFGRKQGGLFVFTPYTSRENSFWFRGTADSMYQNIIFLKKSNEKYVVITSGDAVYKMDYREIIKYHHDRQADITVVYKNMPEEYLTKLGIMQLDEDDRVVDFEEKPLEPQSDKASLGVYVISRELLISLLEETIPEEKYDFVKDVIVRLRRKLKIYGYKYDGYWSAIGTGINEYYNTNMDFLKEEVRSLFVKQRPFIATKPKDEPPVKYNVNADVSAAIVGSGSIINGTVTNSVLFRRVFIGDGAVIRNSILMEGCNIGNDCVIENAILDKEVTVSAGNRILGSEGSPVVVKKGSIN